MGREHTLKRDRACTKRGVLKLLEPPVAEWFGSKFKELTEPQAYAIPLIEKGRNVLVCSPTGTGKTLTAFLSIINNLVKLDRLGRLEDGTYCVYVSPLKALANDIDRNLKAPLSEIQRIAELNGMEVPRIRIGVRTGDTSASKRQEMVRKPPHIFITTPESLALSLSSRKFHEKFTGVQWVIVDEIHELCCSKRGVLLSLTLERLAENRDYTRIGLSATQAPIESVAEYLAGIGRNGIKRRIDIVDVGSKRRIDLRVVSPARGIEVAQLSSADDSVIGKIRDYIKKHKTTLIFTNTRAGAERIAYRLRESGVDGLDLHHGSMSRVKRLSVEERLKKGELRGVVTSTSLELGIDIGSIDLVCQVGSPKTIAKAVQRFGRSGHTYKGVPKGRFIATECSELIECAAIAGCIARHKLDRIRIPENSLDVLAQTIVGMAVERRRRADDAYALIRRSYCYRNLDRETFLSVMEFLSTDNRMDGIYPKIWWDRKSDMFGIRRTGTMIFFMNSGTIMDDNEYKVFSAETGTPVGKLSGSFVERLRPKDVFILGGRTYEFIRSQSRKVYVGDAQGLRPTIPTWVGETMPMSYDLAVEVGRLRRFVADKIINAKTRGKFSENAGKIEKDVVNYLMKYYKTDIYSAREIFRYICKQISATGGIVPNDKIVLIEGYNAPDGTFNVIFHYSFGRKVNDVLARAYAGVLSSIYGCKIGMTVCDAGFMLSSDVRIDLHKITKSLDCAELDEIIKNALPDTELFRQRFRRCASRALAVLRKYKNTEIPVNRQHERASQILAKHLNDAKFPIISETYNEILNMDMDLARAKDTVDSISNGSITVMTMPYTSAPSPFSHSIILNGFSDAALTTNNKGISEHINREIKNYASLLNGERYKYEKEHTLDSLAVSRYFNEKQKRLRDCRKDYRITIGLSEGGLNKGTKKINDDEVCSFIIDILGRYGPHTAGELYKSLSESISADAALVKTCLHALEMEGVLVAGNFSGRRRDAGEDTEYILKKDMIAIQNPGRVAVDEECLMDYCLRKSFSPLRSICKYMSHFRTVYDLYEVFTRVCDFKMSEWKKNIAKRRIIKGRFLNGHLVFILYSDIKDYVALYRREHLDPTEKRILSEISKKSGGMTYREILNTMGKDSADRDELGGCISKLERNVYLARSSRDTAMWMPQNRYVVIAGKPAKDVQSVRKRMILRFIRSRGPVRDIEIERHFGLIHEEAEKCLSELIKKGQIKKITAIAKSSQTRNYYISSNEMNLINEYLNRDRLPDTNIRITTATDPFTSRFIPEIIARYGDFQRYIILKGGRIIGCIEHREMSDRIEIYDIRLERFDAAALNDTNFESTLVEILNSMDNIVKYYKHLGHDAISIRKVCGVPIKNLNKRIEDIFIRMGYTHTTADTMVKCAVTAECFSEKQLRRYMLFRQHIHPENRFETEIEAIRTMHCIRSDDELALRLKQTRFKRLADLFHCGHVLCGPAIPAYTVYFTTDSMLMYKKAKNRKLTSHMKSILETLGTNKLNRKTIFNRSPLGLRKFNSAFRSLQEGLYIIKNKDGLYYATDSLDIPVREARKKIIASIFEQFGIASIDMLYNYLKGEFKMPELRSILSRFEREGMLTRGYFQEGDDTLYWMLSCDLPALRSGFPPEFKGDFVLTPDDRLTYFLSRRLANKFGIRGGYCIFRDGFETGGFKGKILNGRFILQTFVGDSNDRDVMERFALTKGYWITKEEQKTVDDWDVVSYLDKTTGTSDYD